MSTAKEYPFFSVIIASYNPGEKLLPTVESVLSQDCGDWEIIVRDSCSKDGSIEELREKHASDSRLHIVVEKDTGIYDGMNRGIAMAQGRYLYFLNCGDLLAESDVLGRVKAAAMSSEAPAPHIYYGDVRELVTGQVAAANPKMNDFALYRNLPCHQACFYERSLFLERGFDTALKVRADYEHFLWCHYRKNASMISLGFPIAVYEGGGFSEQNRKISAQEHKKITAMYMPYSKRLLFRLYLIVTLQPLREKLAQGKHTAAIYDRIKGTLYKR